MDNFELNPKNDRRNLENELFECWKRSPEGASQEQAFGELRAVLLQHAQALLFTVLRKMDTPLCMEAVDKVLLNLEGFRGESLFTTWAHRIMMGVIYDQRRLDRRRKEVSINIPGFDLVGDCSPALVDILITVAQLLNPEDACIFQELVVQGKTQTEASEILGIPQQTLSRKWERITETLRDALVK